MSTTSRATSRATSRVLLLLAFLVALVQGALPTPHAHPSWRWTCTKGALTRGHELRRADVTLGEAREWCLADTRCVGFTMRAKGTPSFPPSSSVTAAASSAACLGLDNAGPTIYHVFFKAQGSHRNHDSAWVSVQLHGRKPVPLTQPQPQPQLLTATAASSEGTGGEQQQAQRVHSALNHTASHLQALTGEVEALRLRMDVERAHLQRESARHDLFPPTGGGAVPHSLDVGGLALPGGLDAAVKAEFARSGWKLSQTTTKTFVDDAAKIMEKGLARGHLVNSTLLWAQVSAAARMPSTGVGAATGAGLTESPTAVPGGNTGGGGDLVSAALGIPESAIISRFRAAVHSDASSSASSPASSSPPPSSSSSNTTSHSPPMAPPPGPTPGVFRINVHAFSQASEVSGEYQRHPVDADGRAHWVTKKPPGSSFTPEWHLYHSAKVDGGGAAWCFASRVAPIDGPHLWLPDAAPTPPATASWKDASGWTSRIDLVFDVADDYGPGAVRVDHAANLNDPGARWEKAEDDPLP